MSVLYPKKVNKQESGIQYFGSWLGLAGGNEVQLELSRNAAYGKGTFGYGTPSIYGKPLANQAGSSAVSLENNVHFQYNKRLDASAVEDPIDGYGVTAGGIYDTGTSGAFASGKMFRVVENTRNIKDAVGLNLKIYAKNLANADSPDSDRCYVDPIKGTFILPRPDYYNRFEAMNDLGLGDIISTENYPYTNITASGYNNTSYEELITGGKFNNCYRLYSGAYCSGYTSEGNYNRYIYPFSASNINITKGVISCWVAESQTGSTWTDSNANTWAQHMFVIHSQFVVRTRFNASYWGRGGAGYSSYLYLDINGTTYELTSGIARDIWHHIYIAWDSAKGLAGGNSIIVVFNGTSVAVRNDTLPDLTATVPRFQIAHYNWAQTTRDYDAGWAYSYSYVDNLKIFKNKVPTIDAGWEYNSGNGRELAMHPIYGALNNYAPVGLNNGYYYLTDSLTPATCIKPETNTQIELEDPLLYNYGDGYFGAPIVMSNASYDDITEGVDFEYDKRLDASTIDDPVEGFGAISGGIMELYASGSFKPAKLIRVVENAQSVVNPSGIHIKVYAKDLSTTIYPPGDRMYIDPLRGRFIIPKPYYFCKCETTYNMEHPEIGETEAFEVWNPYSAISFDGGKFGNSIKIASDTPFQNGVIARIYPRGLTAAIQHSKGTFSFWWRTDYDYTYIYVYLNAFTLHIKGTENLAQMLMKSGTVHSQAFSPTPGSWYHFYIIWDSAKGLTGGKSLRCLINGGSEIYSTEDLDFTGGTPFYFSSVDADISNQTSNRFDNIKLWDHVVSEDPSWEYNSGTGRENALHAIYSTTNDCAPVMDLAHSSGIGYYMKGGRKNYSRWQIT